MGSALGLAQNRSSALADRRSAVGNHPHLAGDREIAADKLPQTPSRTAPPGLIARIVTGGFTGACITANLVQGILLGAVGAVIGCFAGYQARTRLVKTLAVRDLYVALVEDLVALTGALFIVSVVA